MSKTSLKRNIELNNNFFNNVVQNIAGANRTIAEREIAKYQ